MKYLLIWMAYIPFWPALLCFGLLLFRFKLRPFIPNIAISSLALATYSVIIQTTPLAKYLSILVFIGGALSIWVAFRLHVYHALLIMIVIEITCLLSEWTLNFIIPESVITTINENNMYAFFLTSLPLDLLFLLYCQAIVKFRLGFSFVSRSYSEKKFNTSNSKTLKIAYFLCLLVTVSTSVLFFHRTDIILYLFPVALAGLYLLLRISYKWEMSD